MALTRTTLASAYAVGDNEINVASATGFAAGRIVRIDQEFFVVQSNYSTGTKIPVRGGQMGSAARAHVATSGVVVWPNPATDGGDYDSPGPVMSVSQRISGRGRIIESITADNSTVSYANCPAGNDHVVVLNGTSVINLTVPVPTVEMDGDILIICGNGKAAHVVTVTGGVGAVGATADVITFGANQAQAVQLIAANAVWNFLGPLATATANVSGPSVA